MGWSAQRWSAFVSAGRKASFEDVIFLVETSEDSCPQLETLYDVNLMVMMAIACWTVALGRGSSNFYISRFGSRSSISIDNKYHHYPNTFSYLTLCSWTAGHTSHYSSFSAVLYISKSFHPISTPDIYQLSA